MTDADCRACRRALGAGRDAAAHVATCEPCREFASRLGRVESALAAAAGDAAEAPLSAALRARIVAAAGARAARPAPRGPVLDLFLRAAAVAAVLAAAVWVAPETLRADELDLATLAPTDLGIDRAIAPHVERWTAAAGDAADELPGGSPVLAAGAALLLAAGWATSRTGRRA